MSKSPYFWKGRNFARVSEILSATDDWKSKKALENWGRKNPGGAQRARERGTKLHSWVQTALLASPEERPSVLGQLCGNIHPQHRDTTTNKTTLGLFEKVSHILAPSPETASYFGKMLWVEKSLSTSNRFIVSEKYEYAGTPDAVGHFTHKGETYLTLADWKTVDPMDPNAFYSRKKPSGRGRSYQYSVKAYKKFWKCAIQLCAYAQGLQETEGYTPDRLMVVSIGSQLQKFILKDDERRKATDEWFQRVEKFYAKRDGNGSTAA